VLWLRSNRRVQGARPFFQEGKMKVTHKANMATLRKKANWVNRRREANAPGEANVPGGGGTYIRIVGKRRPFLTPRGWALVEGCEPTPEWLQKHPGPSGGFRLHRAYPGTGGCRGGAVEGRSDYRAPVDIGLVSAGPN